MADIKDIAEKLSSLSPQEVEMLRHAQQYQDIPVRKSELPKLRDSKWWQKFDKKRKKK